MITHLIALYDKYFPELHRQSPGVPEPKRLHGRLQFILEEFKELLDACGYQIVIIDQERPQVSRIIYPSETPGGDYTYKKPDLAAAADALIDIVVVTMGLAVEMGLPWMTLWSDVHRANMSKVRKENGRGGADLLKPPGWQAPRTAAILAEHGYRPTGPHCTRK